MVEQLINLYAFGCLLVAIGIGYDSMKEWSNDDE